MKESIFIAMTNEIRAIEGAFHENADGVIAKLRSVLTDPYCQNHMNMSSVAGFLGELLVGRMLHDRGYRVVHLGRQHGSDLRVLDHGIEIDVKASILKTKRDPAHWGWSLVSGSKKKALKFTHVVCVALDATLEPTGFFVVKQQDLDRFPTGVPPFKNNKRILILARDCSSVVGDSPEQKAAAKLCVKLRDEGIVRHAGNADSLITLLDLN